MAGNEFIVEIHHDQPSVLFLEHNTKDILHVEKFNNYNKLCMNTPFFKHKQPIFLYHLLLLVWGVDGVNIRFVYAGFPSEKLLGPVARIF